MGCWACTYWYQFGNRFIISLFCSTQVLSSWPSLSHFLISKITFQNQACIRSIQEWLLWQIHGVWLEGILWWGTRIFLENAPEARGDSVTTTHFVDADYTGGMKNRLSHTGIHIYLFRAPIIWYSKKHNTVESSTFGSEIVAIRRGMDITNGLRYKIRMMGVPIDRPTSVFCDKNLVVTITSIKNLTLWKKHLGICYHAAREAVSTGIHRIAHISGEFSPTDVITKILTTAVKRPQIGRILY